MFVKESRGISVKLATLAFSLVCASTLISPLGTAFASSEVHCRKVVGKLLDEHIEGPVAVAQMTGAIKGKYVYTLKDQFPADAVLSNLLYTTGTSVVETKDGTLSFFETSSLDAAELGNLNGAVLMTITGGTGQWTVATGHIVLVGFFNQETQTGAWRYQGEVCLP
ncbi:MAG: hypothetical protein HY268_33120 [Deltaproteobacteria bacterium]|nr:hypothetical protein [Deltaproteobacteria bacterium]